VFGVAFAISPQTPRILLDSVTRSSQDENTQIRIEQYDQIPELLAPRPILGAGYLTLDPDIQIFDNAYLTGLIEFGILGLVFTLWWFLLALVRCWAAARSAMAWEKVLPISGALAVTALLAGSATFDAWTFDQFLPTCLIVLGLGVGRSDVIGRRARGEPTPTVAETDSLATVAGASAVESGPDDLTDIKGVGPVTARKLADAGIASIATIAAMNAEELAQRTGSSPKVAAKWIDSARNLR
jgi:hypothetical protein